MGSICFARSRKRFAAGQLSNVVGTNAVTKQSRNVRTFFTCATGSPRRLALPPRDDSFASLRGTAMTKQSRDARLHAFLTDTLALWRVDGTVEAGDGDVVATVTSATGTLLWIERTCEDGVPFRWRVRWRAAGEAPGAP